MTNSRGIVWFVVLAACILGVTPSFGQAGAPENAEEPPVCQGAYPEVKQGAKIRLRLIPDLDSEAIGWESTEDFIQGNMESCGDGIFRFRPREAPDQVLEVPVPAIETLQVSQGRTSHTGKGVMFGFLIGLLISIATQTHHHEEEFLGGLEDAEDNINRGVAVTAVTTMVGAVIGASSGSEKWETVGFYGVNLGRGLDSGSGMRLAAGFSF